MKKFILVILISFLMQSCSDVNTNNYDIEDEQVSETELEFNGENDFIYDDGSGDNESDDGLITI